MRESVLIGIGSNLGSPLANCLQAIQALEHDPAIASVQTSPFYKTDPFGVKDQDPFINAALLLETDLPPSALLNSLLCIETAMGRERKEKWGPRIIDLDLLLFGDQIIDEPGLKVPHPGIPERRFVLTPLNDLVPDRIHPVLKQPIHSLLAQCKDDSRVVRLDT